MKKNSGFTLLELLITTSLTVILLLGITSLFMTFLLGNSITNNKKTVKEEGIQALSKIEFLLKNAHYIDETTYPCTNDMPAIEIVSLDGGSTVFDQEADTSDGNHQKIASNGAYLTSSAVDIVTDLNFKCSGDAGNRQVEISFSLQKQNPNGTAGAQEKFNSIVNIRN